MTRYISSSPPMSWSMLILCWTQKIGKAYCWTGTSHLHIKRMRRASWKLQTLPLCLMTTYHQLNHQTASNTAFCSHSTQHVIQCLSTQTATDPNGLGAVLGDKCMPARNGFDVINKYEKVFKKKKSTRRR